MFQECCESTSNCCQSGDEAALRDNVARRSATSEEGRAAGATAVGSPRGQVIDTAEGSSSAQLHETGRSVTLEERADRSRAAPVTEQTERQWVRENKAVWDSLHPVTQLLKPSNKGTHTKKSRVSNFLDIHSVAITAYQPIDTVTKTVEVPVVRTVDTYVPKVVVEEKIIKVPKYVPEYVEKVVEVPEVKYVDKLVEIPDYQVQYKYVPKVETKENVIQRPKYETKYTEKVVEVSQVKEVVRYQEVEEVEEIIRYVPKGHAIPEEWKRAQEEQQRREEEQKAKEAQEQQTLEGLLAEEKELQEKRTTEQQRVPQEIAQRQRAEHERIVRERKEAERLQYGLPEGAPPMPFIPKVEQVFKPKVVKQVEIQKHVPISVDVPVPYMVPKPVVVPVQVPVLKFRDHFVPVPVRRRVIPRIRWTNEVYEVECIKEKPFLQVQDVIKPVPCDVEIKVHEFVERAAPINPAELSQADIHAMWMRVNADLAEKRKAELGENYPYIKHPPGTVFGEPGCSQGEGEEGGESHEGEAQEGVEPLALHPGHPLNMAYLQNEWIKKETTATHEMYTPEWFEAHQRALHNLTMQHPMQVQLSAEQAAQLQQQEPQFGEAPWLEEESVTHGKVRARDVADSARCCPVCNSTCGGADGICKCEC